MDCEAKCVEIFHIVKSRPVLRHMIPVLQYLHGVDSEAKAYFSQAVVDTKPTYQCTLHHLNKHHTAVFQFPLLFDRLDLCQLLLAYNNLGASEIWSIRERKDI
jgi:hypothetical protein